MIMGVHPVRSPLPAMRRERERESKGWQSQRCPCTLSPSKRNHGSSVRTSGSHEQEDYSGVLAKQ